MVDKETEVEVGERERSTRRLWREDVRLGKTRREREGIVIILCFRHGMCGEERERKAFAWAGYVICTSISVCNGAERLRPGAVDRDASRS